MTATKRSTFNVVTTIIKIYPLNEVTATVMSVYHKNRHRPLLVLISVNHLPLITSGFMIF